MRDRLSEIRPHYRNVAGVVKRRFVLAIRRVVFLVNYHEADILERSKHRRASADRDASVAAANSTPFIKTFALAKIRVENCDLCTENASQTPRENRRQCDLRNQHQRAAAFVESPLHRSNVNLSLAATGHAVEQETFVLAGFYRRCYR